MPTSNRSESLVLVNKQNGMVIIPANTPLTRLNYFDGKFLRAQDLKLEQDYLRQLVRESNQAGGPGVAHGYDLTAGAGDTLQVSPGLAIDPQGRVLLLPQEINVGVQELIDKSRDLERFFGKVPAAGSSAFGDCELHNEEPQVDLHQTGDLFLIIVSSAEAFCGEEDVYGKLCEEACVTATDHPYIIEGVAIRAVPLPLTTPLPAARARNLTQVHLRSRVAAAYFEQERLRGKSSISAFGLKQQVWCLDADGPSGSGVAIGVLARAGSETVFLDPWIPRRERIDPPARRYWQWRMMMRPWDVFLAQVLQFQCQLRDLFLKTPALGKQIDPCGGAHGVINEAAATIADLREFYRSTTERFTALNVNLEEAITFQGGLTRLTDLNRKLISVSQTLGQLPEDEFLLRYGIVELPSAGYLPVTVGDGPTINQQVRRLMGEGVDLRFCVVRPDYVAHALEEAQHLERISLVEGLDDPDNKPQVDILVPDGKVIEERQPGQGGLAASLRLYPSAAERFMWAIGQAGRDSTQFLSILGRLDELDLSLTFNGAARHEALTNGHGFYAALLLDDSFVPALVQSFFLQPPVATSVSSEVAKEAGSPIGLRDTAAAEAPFSLFSTIKDLAFKRRDRPELLGATILGAVPLEVEQPFEEPTLPAGLWLEATCDQDPRTMRNDQTLRINGRVLLASTIPFAGGMPGYFDVRFNVDALVTDAGSKADGSSFIKCNAAVFGSIIASLGGSKQSEARSVNLEIEIAWSTADDGRTDLRIVIRDLEDEMTLIFRGTSTESSTGLKGAVTEGKIQSVGVGVRSDPDVLKSDDDRHRRAIKALETIGDTIRNPSFFSVASNRLFPPIKPASELIVRGTKDWVMFHRRRTKKCSIDVPPAPPPPPPRRYAIALMNLEDRGQLESLRDALKNPSTAGEDLIKRLGVRRVDIVEFESGAATLVSQPAQIQNDWHARSPGNLLLYGGIASNTVAAAEGTAIAQGRLNRIEKVVSAISQPVPNVTLEVISAVPTPLVLPDTDGTIVMVTAQEVTTVCHTVYRAENDQVLAEAQRLISQGKIADAIKPLKPLGNVQFQRDQVVVTNAQSLADVVKAWTATPGSAEHSAICFAPSTATDVQTRFKNQTKLIRNAIRQAMEESPIDIDPGVETTTSALPTQCPTFSIITVAALPPPPTADLQIAKTAVLDMNALGQQIITFSLVVGNRGPSIAQNVTVTDTLPPNTTFDSVQVPMGSGWSVTTTPNKGQNGRVVFSKGQVPKDDSITLKIVAVVGAIQVTMQIDNTAAIASTSPVGNNSSTSHTAVSPKIPDLTIEKVVQQSGPFHPGDPVSYQVIVRNNGLGVALRPKLIEPIPEHLVSSGARQVTGSSAWTPTTPPSNTSGDAVFEAARLDAGDTAEFRFDYTIDNQLKTNVLIVNTVRIESQNGSTKTDSKEITVTIPVQVVTRTALLIFATNKGQEFFPEDGPNQRTTIAFQNNNPQDAPALQRFVDSLASGSVYAGIVLKVNGSSVDSGATERVNKVTDAVTATGRSLSPLIKGAELLTDSEKQRLNGIGINSTILNGFAEVIFLIITKGG